MAHGNITIPVPGELRAVDVNSRVVSADGVYDYNESKSQETVNAEIKEALGTGGSVDSRISSAVNAAKSEIRGTATSACDTLGEAEAKINANATAISNEATARANAVSAEASRAQAKEQLLQEQYNALTQSNIIVGALPASGTKNKIYRVPGTTSYSDYMWNGSSWVLMATYSNSIDVQPTPNSENLVYSGGILTYLEGKDMISNYTVGKKFNGGIEIDAEDWGISPFIPVSQGDTVLIDFGGADFDGYKSNSVLYDNSKTIINGFTYDDNTRTQTIASIQSGGAFIRFPFTLFHANTVSISVNNVIVWTPESRNYTQKGCICYPENYKKALNYIVDLQVFAPEEVIGSFYIVYLEYLNGRFVFGFKNYINDAEYYGETESFTKPVSGIETLGLIFNNQKFIHANITVDWGKYITEIDEQGTSKVWGDIILNVKPLSQMDKICGKYIRFESSIVTLNDVNIKGDNVIINVYDNGLFLSVSNVTFDGITFNYIGNNAITTRVQKAESGYDSQLWEPLKTPTQYAENQILNGSSSLIKIAAESGQVTVRNCVFKGFPNYVIRSNANGRHIYPNHSVIEGNMFYFCLCGVFQGEEFMRFAHNEFVGCGVGVYCQYSDVNMVDNKFLRCDCGLYFPPGNDAYGQANDCVFVHSSIAAIYAHLISPSLGFSINGCTISQGMVYCSAAYALSITNCFLDTHFLIEAGSKNRICFNMMKKGDATLTQSDLYNVPSDTQITLNRAIVATDNDSDFNI